MSARMGARPAVFNRVWVGAETAIGDPVPASKRLIGIQNPTIQANDNITAFRSAGSAVDEDVFQGLRESSGDLAGAINIPDLVYLLSGHYGAAVITTPGGATNARRWTWTPKADEPVTPKSLTIDLGSKTVVERAPGCLVNQLALGFRQKQPPTIQASWIGQGVIDPATPSAAAQGSAFRITWASPVPATYGYTILVQIASGGEVLSTSPLTQASTALQIQTAIQGISGVGAGQVTVTLNPAGGGDILVQFGGTLAASEISYLGVGIATNGLVGTVERVASTGAALTDLVRALIGPKSTRVEYADSIANLAANPIQGDGGYLRGMDLAFPQRFVTHGGVNTDDSWSVAEEAAATPTWTLSLEKSTAAGAMIQHLRNGAVRYLRLTSTSAKLIEAGFPYRMVLTMAVQAMERASEEQDGSYLARVAFGARYDATLGGFVKIEVDTAQTAL